MRLCDTVMNSKCREYTAPLQYDIIEGMRTVVSIIHIAQMASKTTALTFIGI